jgi:hypothetical protein
MILAGNFDGMVALWHTNIQDDKKVYFIFRLSAEWMMGLNVLLFLLKIIWYVQNQMIVKL